MTAQIPSASRGDDHGLTVRLAQGAGDLMSAQRLRYAVFVREMGGDGALVDHTAGLERDEFDAVMDHLILVDDAREAASDAGYVVGAYRLLRDDRAREFGRFYCDREYDLTPLKATGRRLLELGRSCVHADYRGGTAMYLLWNALAEYVVTNEVEVLFGVASFHGTDMQALRMPLAWLHQHHLAPPELRVAAKGAERQAMDLVSSGALDRRAAMLAMPALIKAYLRLGGFVGDGAFVDRAFNTTDVCLLMDTAAMSARHKDHFLRHIGHRAE